MIRYRIIYQNSNLEAPEGRFDIGRSLDCNLVLDDLSVSRLHACIVKENDCLYLEDLGSSNGCKINGKKAPHKIQLHNLDEIKIGYQKIKILQINPEKDITGLFPCPSCQKMIPRIQKVCPFCQNKPDNTQKNKSKETIQLDNDLSDTQLPVIHSNQMLCNVAQKAISKGKLDEALRLVRTIARTLEKTKESNKELINEDIEEAASIFMELAILQKKPEYISELFTLFIKLERLLPRKTTETLFENVRAIGYISCPQMNQYLLTLDALSTTFNPGEKYIHSRIKGLTSICR